MRANIIFLCTSNVCRSPIAEWLTKKCLAERHGVGIQDLEQVGYRVQSRGISTAFEPQGSPASPHGITIMREDHGVDMTTHRSAMLSEKDMLEATHIYCMAQRHQNAVIALKKRMEASSDAQQWLESPLTSASTLSSCSDAGEEEEEEADAAGNEKKTPPSPRAPLVVSVFQPEVPDPWHGTIEFYRECQEVIASAVKKALDEEISENNPNSRQDQQQGDGEPTERPTPQRVG